MGGRRSEWSATDPEPGITRIMVDLGERSYEVHVGPGARRLVGGLLPRAAMRVAVVTQDAVVAGGALDGLSLNRSSGGTSGTAAPGSGLPGSATADVAATVRAMSARTEIEHRVFTIAATEAEAKTLSEIERLCSSFAAWGLHRHDAVVAVGGGVVTDVAGFAAAVYHRGIAFVNVATTLLAQVDAAIGGKTGVNLPEGKNLVGAFWHPAAVICDTELLGGLPAEERRSGLGEMVKYAFLGAGDLRGLPIEEQVARCAQVKATVVAGDEREGGRRMTLNYGHTLGHALEAAAFASAPAPAYGGHGGTATVLRHGEAVAIGLVFAAELARALGRIDDRRVAYHRDLVADFGLPTEVPPGSSTQGLITYMERDKKVRDGLTFVLDGPSGVEPVTGVAAELVAEVLGAMGCMP
ncbi:MAG: 3-dehydroquinate synthase [Actinomycetota bacterium]|nr:3-dehydroquinate synthase [Actinomycetota bacterium]